MADSPPLTRLLSGPAQTVLRQCSAELEQALNHASEVIRHAFFAVGGSSNLAVTKSLIDLTLGKWLGADKYDSLALGPVRYPLRSGKQAELWHVFLVNGTVNRASMDQWCSTLANLDRLTRNRAFSETFADVPESEGWLLQLYRLVMRHPEWGLGELCGASLPESGGILPAPVLCKCEFFESWLIGQSVLPDGDHFSMLFDDIRRCSLRAVRRSESDSRQKAEATSDSSRSTTAKLSAERGGNQIATRLLNVYTNGLAEERFVRASNVLKDDKLTVDEKLRNIDTLMPIPPTVSAAKLGKALGVSKTAVQKTAWYIRNRKGQKENEIGRRREQHHQRAQQYQSDRTREDD